MNRKEVYEVIKKMNLQEVVKKIYNKNYTNVPTDALLQVIANTQSFIPSQVEEEELRTHVPDFWEHPKEAQIQMKKIKDLSSVYAFVNWSYHSTSH